MFDVAVIGSGMGGSVSAAMLAKRGWKVLLLERGKHPRFVIGESTTPLVSKKLRYLGREFGIPEFENMATYDAIKENDLPFTCAPKELFHYFWQEKGQETAQLDDTMREIIVQTPEVDTQLVRGESDAYLVDVAKDYDVDFRDMTMVNDIHFYDDKVTIDCESEALGVYSVDARFVIDGTGFKSLISQKLNLACSPDEYDIPLKSRSIFSHFSDVGDFEQVSEASEAFKARTPADRSRATQHHCFDGGWLWVIPFHNGTTSIGLNLDIDKFPENEKTGEEEFWEIVQQYPIVNKMLEGRKTKFPLIKTGRIQFRQKSAAGDRWAMLPGAATGGDAWFSTGLAFTLMCAHRIVDILDQKLLPSNQFSKTAFDGYEKNLFHEWRSMCTMVDGIYKSFKHYEVFKHYCFFCFMGAETFIKNNGVAKPHDNSCLLLNCGDPQFMANFNEFYNFVLEVQEQDSLTDVQIAYMRDFIQNRMKPYNLRDYGNPVHGGVHKRMVMGMKKPQETVSKVKAPQAAVV